MLGPSLVPVHSLQFPEGGGRDVLFVEEFVDHLDDSIVDNGDPDHYQSVEPDIDVGPGARKSERVHLQDKGVLKHSYVHGRHPDPSQREGGVRNHNKYHGHGTVVI